jgi:peptidoglycan L-alanyl-D-glutamate endopeptidase CwlK
MDKITLDRIKTAHPKIREELLFLFQKANNQLGKNVRLRFAYVYRSPAEQDALFKLRPKVTNAKGWQSIHNYGLAFDIVLLIDKDNNGTFETASYEQNTDWMTVVKVFKDAGWEWGGDWKNFKDAPHFQKTYGFHWQVLKQRFDREITIKDDNGITYPKI